MVGKVSMSGIYERTWDAQWLGWRKEFCQSCQKEHLTTGCPYLPVILAPEEYLIVVTDIGSSVAQHAPMIGDEWHAIWSHGTRGGGHKYVAYARKGITANNLAKFLGENLQTPLSAVKQHGETIIIWSSKLGLWIGQQGCWAKAYRRLGVKVEFRELVEIKEYELYRKCREETRLLVDNQALASAKVKNFGNWELTYGLDPKSQAWKAVQSDL